MKSLSKTIPAIILLAISLNAKVWKLDNVATNASDFQNLAAAHNGALAGDTIYVAGSQTSYGNFTFTKKLTLIGPGYFLDENPDSPVHKSPAIVGDITINSTATGFVVCGMTTAKVTANCENMLIKRSNVTGQITLNESNCGVLNNFIVLSSSTNAVVINKNNILLSNNFIKTSIGYREVVVSQNGSANIVNNVLYSGGINAWNSIIQNNILRSGTFTHNNACTYTNNIGNSTQFGESNGNQSNVDMNFVFTGTGSTDSKWQLQQGAVAIGAGTNGVDCGIFGGNYPYVLSGMPGIPVILYIDAPAVANAQTGLPVRVKVKSNKVDKSPDPNKTDIRKLIEQAVNSR